MAIFSWNSPRWIAASNAILTGPMPFVAKLLFTSYFRITKKAVVQIQFAFLQYCYYTLKDFTFGISSFALKNKVHTQQQINFGVCIMSGHHTDEKSLRACTKMIFFSKPSFIQKIKYLCHTKFFAVIVVNS